MAVEDQRRAVTILIAENDDGDFQLARETLREARLANPIERVRDGQELLDYLQWRGTYAVRPTPGLILLDRGLRTKEGGEVLREIQKDAKLRHLPVVVLTKSPEDEDVFGDYDPVMHAFIRKPVSFGGLVDALKALRRYWFEIVYMPAPDPGIED